MVLGCSTSGHSSRTAASETVHGTWSQGVCGRSVTRVSVTAGDGFGEFFTGASFPDLKEAAESAILKVRSLPVHAEPSETIAAVEVRA